METTLSEFRWEDHIEDGKEEMLGKPVFRGTRLPVELIFNEIDAGTSERELLDNYPTLKAEHIRAAMIFATARRNKWPSRVGIATGIVMCILSANEQVGNFVGRGLDTLLLLAGITCIYLSWRNLRRPL